MKKIIFDTNCFDQIAKTPDMVRKIRTCIESKKIQVIDELSDSPFKEVPDWFPVLKLPESVFLLDYAYMDEDKLGAGKVYEQHKGISNQFKDALIADLADNDCNLVVTEDERCRRLLNKISRSCKAISFSEFHPMLNDLYTGKGKHIEIL
jgi:hypothetical protein